MIKKTYSKEHPWQWTCKNYLADSRQASTNCRTLAITPMDLQPQRLGTNALTTCNTTKSSEHDSNASTTNRLVNDWPQFSYNSLVTSSSTGTNENRTSTCTKHLIAEQKTFFTNRTEEYFLSHYNFQFIKDWKRTSGVHLSDSSDSDEWS